MTEVETGRSQAKAQHSQHLVPRDCQAVGGPAPQPGPATRHPTSDEGDIFGTGQPLMGLMGLSDS